ncbi:MAG: DUF6133 family protein [Oscillospiraceae bacterium]|nr:DUF6133 family protein [Oscillospiraceae bacterium]
MKKIKTTIITAKTKACAFITRAKDKLTDTSGEGHVDVAVKIIIAVVIGALVLAGLVALWNTVIMPRLNGEINNLFG